MNSPALSNPLRPIKASGGEVRPVIVIDTRERTPLAFRRLNSVHDTLAIGDYSLRGAEDSFAVERKSIADLVNCCTGREQRRFDRQLHRLRVCRFRRLVIAGHRTEVEQHRYRSNLSPEAILRTVARLEVRYDVPVVWAGSIEDAAALIECWVWWYAQEVVEQANAILRACVVPSACGDSRI